MSTTEQNVVEALARFNGATDAPSQFTTMFFLLLR
jgi:hypothetical protein